MDAAQAGQGGLEDAIALEIVPPAPHPPLLIEAHKSKQNLLGPLKIPGDIVLNLALNGYSTLADLASFGHKDFEYFCSDKIRQYFKHGGANYIEKVIKRLQGLVWRSSEMKRLKQPPS